MTINKQTIGRLGETAACEYLVQNGLTIIARNFRTPHGEIDIIASEKNTLVFFEVKTRTSNRFGNPEDAVDNNKASHMIDSAEYYLQANEFDEEDWQLDVIAVEINQSHVITCITRYEDAISDE